MSARPTSTRDTDRWSDAASRSVLLLLTVVALTGGAAEAGYVNTINSGPSRSSRFDPLPTTCVNGQTSTGPLSCDVIDPVYHVESRASAYGDASGGHVTARTTFATSLGSTTVLNEATSELSDVLTFIGPHPATAIVSVTANSLGGGNGNRFGEVQIGDGDLGSECLFQRETTSCTTSALVSLQAGLQLHLYVSALAWAGYFPNGELLDVAENNFGYIAALGFTDLAGNPLALSYVTQTGFTYPMASAPAGVPEPSTLALLLGSAWGMASRRRGNPASRRPS